MTFLIARIDAALTGTVNKLCNAIDASLYHDWDLEDTPNDGADPLADDDRGPASMLRWNRRPHLAVSQARPAPRADR
jgi:hypothetical protein